MKDDPIVAMAARFGPTLKGAFPNEHSVTRLQVADALAEIAIATLSTEPDRSQVEDHPVAQVDREAVIQLIREQLASTDYPVSDFERKFADAILKLVRPRVDREAVARVLADRFIERGKARVIDSAYSSYDEMPWSLRKDFLADADALIAAGLITSRPREGRGMVLVPREPTEAMQWAGMNGSGGYVSITGALRVWYAMIAAAPTSEAANG